MIKDLVIKWPYIEQGYLQGLETGENTLMYHTGLVGHAKLMISEGVDYTRENIDDALDIYANNAGLNPTWVATMRDSMSVDEKVSFFKSIKMIADCKTYIEEFKNKYQQAKQSGSLKDFFESAINETDACLPARTRTIADYRPKKQYSQADAVSIFNDTSKTHVSQQVYEYIKIVSGQEPSEVKLKWADYRDQIVDAIARSSSHNRLFGSAFTQQEVTSETIDEMLYDLKEYAMIEFSDVDYSDDEPVYRPQ